jgi:hypothetical protein
MTVVQQSFRVSRQWNRRYGDLIDDFIARPRVFLGSELTESTLWAAGLYRVDVHTLLLVSISVLWS